MKNEYLNNKYYCNLDDYNKNLIAHRSNFFSSSQGYNFFEFLETLSFNLNYNSPNYRWGKRFFHTEDKEFRWITSNSNKKIIKSVWDKETFSYKEKEFNAYFSQDNINDHFLSCYKSNRKINFFYKLTPIEQQELNSHITALQNMYMVNCKTFGSSQKIGTDILLVDIDNYPDKPAIKTLQKFLTKLNFNIKDCIFLEQNAFTGGIHTAIRLSCSITNPLFYPKVMNKFKNDGIRIECNFINTILRFPLSFEYVAIKKTNEIFNYDEFIPESLWEKTFDEYLSNLSDTICQSDYLNSLIIESHKQEISFDKWKCYWKTKKQLFKKPSKQIIKSYDFYKIESGNRYETMRKIIPYGKMMGMSLNEIIDKIYEVNINSKDLQKWSREKLTNNVRKFYNNCPDQIYTSLNTHKSFVSNLSQLPQITKDFLNNEQFINEMVNRFEKIYLSLRNKHNNGFKEFSKEKKDILKIQLPYMLKEIIGKMFYDLNSDKEYINKDYNYILGFQLSDTHLKAIQEQSIIDLKLDSQLSKTSLQYLKKTLLSLLNIKEIKYKNRERNWMLGSCKSYKIKTLNDIYEMLNHLYRSVFNNIYIKSKLNNQTDLYNLLILYISLIENYDFCDYDSINWMYDVLSAKPPE